MFLNNTDKELISKLKGRLSKVLGVQLKQKLTKEEVLCLENVYDVIDKVITGHKKYNNVEVAKKDLTSLSSTLKGSKRKYIREHIIPLINKVATKRWGTDE